jgi:hypothetical protein
MVDQIPPFYHNRKTVHFQEEGPADALEFLDHPPARSLAGGPSTPRRTAPVSLSRFAFFPRKKR